MFRSLQYPRVPILPCLPLRVSKRIYSFHQILICLKDFGSKPLSKLTLFNITLSFIPTSSFNIAFVFHRTLICFSFLFHHSAKCFLPFDRGQDNFLKLKMRYIVISSGPQNILHFFISLFFHISRLFLITASIFAGVIVEALSSLLSSSL